VGSRDDDDKEVDNTNLEIVEHYGERQRRGKGDEGQQEQSKRKNNKFLLEMDKEKKEQGGIGKGGIGQGGIRQGG